MTRKGLFIIHVDNFVRGGGMANVGNNCQKGREGPLRNDPRWKIIADFVKSPQDLSNHKNKWQGAFICVAKSLEPKKLLNSVAKFVYSPNTCFQIHIFECWTSYSPEMDWKHSRIFVVIPILSSSFDVEVKGILLWTKTWEGLFRIAWTSFRTPLILLWDLFIKLFIIKVIHKKSCAYSYISRTINAIFSVPKCKSYLFSTERGFTLGKKSC